MSATQTDTAVVAPVAAVAPAAKAAETLASKVQKHVDSLHAKIAKLAEENDGLKAQLRGAKASNSRIRRIPRKATDAPAA